MKRFVVLAALAATLSARLAAMKTVALSVPGMTCASCPSPFGLRLSASMASGHRRDRRDGYPGDV